MLWSFAFAQPLFDLLADNPDFFVARGNTRFDIIVLAVVLTVLPPSLLFAVELVSARIARLRQALHLVFVGLLSAAIVLQLLGGVGASAAVLVAVAVAAGALVGWLYTRSRLVPTLLTVLGPAPLAFLLIFLLISPVSKLVLPSGDDGLAGAAELPSATTTPVVFIAFDELSLTSMDARGRIDPALYPGFARLARGSTWFRNATTVADLTRDALPAILTGTRAQGDALPIAADYPGSIFTLLSRDYALDVEESFTRLCPEALCERDTGDAGSRWRSLTSDLGIVSLRLLLPEDLEADLPAVDQTFSDFAGGDRGDRPLLRQDLKADRGRLFREFGARAARGPDRSLHFTHVELPHIPWVYLPSGRRYPNLELPVPGITSWGEDPVVPTLALERYLLQLRYVDRLVGQLLDRLRAAGTYDRSLIVLTADHGLSFRPGLPRRLVTRATFADIAGVPMFIKAPGQREGRIDDRYARTLDILPTVAEHLGLRVPWQMDGHSLRRPPVPVERLAVSSHARPGVTMPASVYGLRLRAEAAGLNRRLTASNGGDLVPEGPDAGLLGRRVDQLPVSSAGADLVTLDFPEAFEDVDPLAPSLPAWVGGRIDERIDAGRAVAIGVNGYIREVARTWDQNGEIRFGGMVPAGFLRRGANSVEVFALKGASARRRLVALGSGQARIVRRDGTELLSISSERPIPVRDGTVDGQIDRVFRVRDVLIVEGWAAEMGGARADRVFLFAGGRLLASAQPNRVRSDIARSHGPRARRAGFLLSARTDQAEELVRSGRARVFAAAGGRVSELGSDDR